MEKETFDLDTCLIEFAGGGGSTRWTVRDAVEGIQIFGGIGSGKTSGSGRTLALKFLSNGFGGLVLTAKPDERQLWGKYCEETGRLDDLIILEPNGKHHFNFLQYEASRSNAKLSTTANLVEVLKTVIRAGEERSGRSDDQFWDTSLDMLVNNVIDLCLLAYEKVDVQEMFDIVSTAPRKKTSENNQKKEQATQTAFDRAIKAAQGKISAEIQKWRDAFTEEEREVYADKEALNSAIQQRFAGARLLKSVDQFFSENYLSLSEKTRTIIEFIFSGFLFHLLKDPVYSLFCRHASTVTPEDCLDGKIILIDLPVKTFHKVGRDCQILFKYIWQRAMERRRIEENGRPQFLWADEAQNFLHEHDSEYQATARSSRIATVYISQNLPNYFASMGGRSSEYRVKSFLGTLGTKILHANADGDTNLFGSQLIGSAYVEDLSRNVTLSGQFSTGETASFRLEQMVRPEQFAALKTGGPRNNHIVEAYIHKQGNAFAGGLNFQKVSFRQQ